MNFSFLQAFLVVAQQSSFSTAAKLLHISQPAISMQIQALEEQYGCRLMDRSGRKVVLTAAGVVLKNYAERIMEMCSQAEREINETMNQVKGDLQIGASMTIGGHYLPGFLKEFFKKFPQVKISMIVNNTEKIIAGVVENSFDIGLIEGQLEGHDLPSQVFAEDEMVVVAPAGHPLGSIKQKVIEVEEFIRYPLVLRERGSGTRDVLEKAIKQKGISVDSLRVVMELGSTEAVKGAVEEGIGICVLSQWTVRKEVAGGIFKELYLKDMSMKRTFKLVSNSHRFQTLAVKTFIDELLSYGDDCREKVNSLD